MAPLVASQSIIRKQLDCTIRILDNVRLLTACQHPPTREMEEPDEMASLGGVSRRWLAGYSSSAHEPCGV